MHSPRVPHFICHAEYGDLEVNHCPQDSRVLGTDRFYPGAFTGMY